MNNKYLPVSGFSSYRTTGAKITCSHNPSNLVAPLTVI